MTGELLNAKEAMAALEMGRTKFHELRRAGQLRMFTVKIPMGQKRYSRVLIERYKQGESPIPYGKGSRSVTR